MASLGVERDRAQLRPTLGEVLQYDLHHLDCLVFRSFEYGDAGI